MTGLPADERSDPVARNIERIRAAALVSFAARGVAATSLREVAGAAGVSIGLVQHHFGTKAGLVDAVDRHAAEVLQKTLASGPGPTTVDAFGEKVTALLVQHPMVVDYLSRALVDGTPFGSSIFDILIEQGLTRWENRAAEGLTRPDLDHTWAALNPVLLFFGTVLLRAHIDRHLPAPFTSPEQLARWGVAVNDMWRKGQFLPDA
mgnify:CR=1 FL=1